MVGKNNTQERFRRNATKDKRYTLKKLSVGLASVALGTVLFLNGAETVSAEAEVVDPNTPDTLATQPVQETFHFNYLNQATGARLDGFFGDYVNANEAEKAFRHYANEQGYTLLNVRLEGHTFTADVAVEQGVQPEVEQEAQPAESTFQFIYRDKETGEKFDSFFGDYVNENEAEKDFRHYANQHGYTLLNVRLEGHTFTADVAVEQEAQPAESAFQFIYRDKETGEKFDSFFGDYANENEAEKDFRHYANQHGYTLLNVRQNGHTFTADVARDSQSEETPEVEKGYSYALNFDGRTESANLGEFDSEEQAELALRIFANEQGYELSNLRLEGRTFHADAKVAAEADEPSESTDRYLQEAKDRARGIINGLENLFDTQKPSYLERIEDADSVAAVEAIVEEAQNYVNEGKGGENGQATEEPEKPEYNPEENLVTYDLQITDQNGRTQTQKVTFPSRELALNYISQLVRSYEKAGVVLNEERSDVEGKDNTFILVFEEKQAEEPAKADYTVKVIVDGEERQSQALPDTTRQGAIDYAERLAKSYEQDGFTYNHLDAGLPSDTVIRIELSSPELDVPSHTEDAPAPEALDVTKAEALDIIAGLDLDDVIKDNLVYEINQAEDEATVGQVIAKAYKIVAAGLAEEPTPELDSEEEAGRELDAAKAEALDAIAGLEHLSEEEKAGFVDRINETTELGEVNRLVGLAFKRNIENFPAPTPELDPEEEAGRELDAAKAEALDAIAGLEHLSEEEKADFVDRINETTELGEVNRLVGLAFKRNIENFPESTPELDPEEEAGRELDVAKAEALDAIAGLEYLSEEEKADFVDRINETTELGEVNRLVGLAFKRNIENFPAPTPELDPEEEAGRELDAAKVGALEDIANLDYFTADEKQDLVDRINDYDNTGDIDFIVSKAIEENDARHKAAEALKAHKEKAIKDLKAKGFDNDFVFGLIDKANTKEGVDALVEELNAKPEAEFDLDAYKELVKNELKAKGFDNDFVFGLIDKANTKEGVDALVEELNAKPEAEFDLGAYKELVKNELKAKGFDNDFVFGLIDKANTKEGVDALVEELNAKPEAEFDLDAYKELVKNELKAKGFDNDFVFGLIDKATNKEGVDALVANIDLDELNKLNNEFGQLEQKAEDLNNELEALINKVEGKEEVAQEDLDAILNKVNEIRENLDKMQKHINILSSEERENAQAELDQVKELLDKVEEQYSYSFDLDAYKEEVKDSLKAQGFDNKFVFELIDKATNKEGVDALVANIDLDELNKLNNEFGQLEQKAEDLNNELEALINKVEGKEEVAQEDLDAILNKVNEIRENLDKMQKHINILPSEERENAQAELDQVKELLDKVEEQYSYSFDLDAYKEEAAEIVDKLDNLSDEGKAVIKDEINQATTTEEVDRLVDEAKGISSDNDEFDASRLEGHKESATKVVDQFVEEALLSEEQAGNFKKAIENAEDLDTVDSVVEAVLKQVFDNQKAAAVQDVEDDINLSESLKEKYVPLLEGAETPEQLDEILLNLDKEEAAEIVDKLDNLSDEGKAVIKDEINQATTTEEVDRLVDEAKGISSDNDEFDASRLEGHKEGATKVVDQFVEEALLSEEQAGNFKKAIENAEDLDTVDSVVEAVLKQVFDNQKATVVQSVKDDINLSETLKGKYVPKLEAAETAEELDKLLLELDKDEVRELIDEAVANNYLAASDAE
ncbi:albumin-binding GA domain-containing protein, partial [Dolosigranulum pigrum]